jgi:hypothetical protein
LRARLTTRLDDATGQVQPRLRALHDHLAAHERPDTVLAWLHKDIASSILGEIASGQRELSHKSGLRDELRDDTRPDLGNYMTADICMLKRTQNDLGRVRQVLQGTEDAPLNSGCRWTLAAGKPFTGDEQIGLQRRHRLRSHQRARFELDRPRRHVPPPGLTTTRPSPYELSSGPGLRNLRQGTGPSA